MIEVTLYETLKSKLEIPIIYLNFKSDEKNVVQPPFIAYTGIGQDKFLCDNTIYVKRNSYRLEYYFTTKDEELENKLEDFLLELGFIYTKSGDISISDENVSVIYYDI